MARSRPACRIFVVSVLGISPGQGEAAQGEGSVATMEASEASWDFENWSDPLELSPDEARASDFKYTSWSNF